MDGVPSGGGDSFFSPLCIFLLVVALQSLDGFLDIVKKKGMTSEEEVQLRKEIKELYKEASSLSTPSTFAQSAKLKRLAAAKEKELLRKQEERKKEKTWYCCMVVLYFGFGEFLLQQFPNIYCNLLAEYCPGSLEMLPQAKSWLA
ncbi:hypothetical protein ZIOFF_052568 [Zingiber officinale]|uniref:Uncharacterized protein n=1 Tax=Zingiber officinale TaxID=94328 RepID=A0A8J5FKF1_ZINOF|nr:hypothetical protein ZIOFF_052568 [Zingiber officinale]